MKTRIYIKCAECGKVMQKRNGTHKYCSAECARKVHLTQMRDYAKVHKDERNEAYLRRYHKDQEFRDKVKSRTSAWKEKNKGKCRDYSKQYYIDNKEYFKKYYKRYHLKHKDRVLEAKLCAQKHNNCFSCPYDDCIKG